MISVLIWRFTLVLIKINYGQIGEYSIKVTIYIFYPGGQKITGQKVTSTRYSKPLHKHLQDEE
jgi:hypothetical protein